MDDRIKQRLIKILTLARRGIGGEKENAERMLNNLLKKYSLTLADLEDDEKIQVDLRFKGKHERDILVQCVYSTIKGWDQMAYSDNRRGLFRVKVTKAEGVELALKWNAHRKAFKKEVAKQMNILMLAYVSRNHLYSDAAEDENNEESSLSLEDIEAIVAIARRMDRTAINKSIESSRSAA